MIATGGGVALLVVGLAVLGYTAYLDLIHAGPVRWFDRVPLLLPTALLLMFCGLLLTL